MRRELVVALAAVAALAGCGVPSVQEARSRAPGAGASERFARPYAEVYAATKRVLMDEIGTPEWKELRVVVDDPAGGVLIAERVLRGIVPGVRVRDLWSFYLTSAGESLTAVTFVLESSDRPAAATGARSWAKARGSIFPAIADALGPSTVAAAAPGGAAAPSAAAPAPARTFEPAAVPTVPEESPATEGSSPVPPSRASAAPEEGELPPATPPATPESPASRARTALDRAYAALQASGDWRPSVKRRVIAGEDVVTVGEWAQLTTEGGDIQVAFPTYPAPPAYDVARLMRFLADAGFGVDVLPGTSFRAR